MLLVSTDGYCFSSDITTVILLPDLFLGGVFSQSDMSHALSEIHKIDPNFDKESFIQECKYDIIPTVLEAFLQGKLDILKDWCHEAVS